VTANIGLTRLAGRHLSDVCQIGHVIDAADRSALNTVLAWVAADTQHVHDIGEIPRALLDTLEETANIMLGAARKARTMLGEPEGP